MSTLKTALKFWPETKKNEWTLINETWVHIDAIVSVPKENLQGGYIRSGKFFENAKIFDEAKVFENSEVYGDSWVFGDSEVYENSQVYGGSEVYGDSEVCGNILLSKNENIFTISNIGSRSSTLTIVKSDCGNIFMITGCFYGTLDEFKKAVSITHEDNKYAKEYLKFCEYIEFKFKK